MKHPDKKNEMPLRDYSWIIFLPFVALGWMAFKAALENAAALIVWLVYSLFLLFPILLILRYPDGNRHPPHVRGHRLPLCPVAGGPGRHARL